MTLTERILIHCQQERSATFEGQLKALGRTCQRIGIKIKELCLT
jgi:hypothetical protein